MYQKMLVPLDGSELAEVVFTYAKELVGRLDINIVLLHVSTLALREFAPMRKAYVERAAEILQRQSRQVQRRTGIPPETKPVEVRGELAEGYPAEEILRYAEENAIDFILMATHGYSGFKRWTLGSVADKVLRVSKVPVWLVRAGIPEQTPYDRWPKTTIIVPLDGSKLAESVLPHVEALGKQRGTEVVDVVLLRICEPPPIPTYFEPGLIEPPMNWGDHVQQELARERQAAIRYLARVEKQLKDAGVRVRSEVLVGTGKAAEQIIDYANKNPFNLIVMATHGRSGLGRLVYGSVAANILHGVSSPIFLVKPQ